MTRSGTSASLRRICSITSAAEVQLQEEGQTWQFADLQPRIVTGTTKGFWRLQGDSCISLQGLVVMGWGLQPGVAALAPDGNVSIMSTAEA